MGERQAIVNAYNEGRLADALRRIHVLPKERFSEVQDIASEVNQAYKEAEANTLVYKWDNPKDEDFMKNMLLGYGTFFLEKHNQLFTRDYLFIDEVRMRVRIDKDYGNPAEFLHELGDMEIMVIEPAHDFDIDTSFSIAAQKYNRTYGFFPGRKINTNLPAYEYAVLSNNNYQPSEKFRTIHID